MELKEGMYVRTEKGKIIKIEKLHIYEHDKILVNINGYLVNSLEILKASYNIIDLIEEKDFCEIEFYSERYKERVKRIFEVGYVARGERSHISFENAHCQLDIINGEWSKHDKCLNPEIKSIVTKEQFESVSYKVGGK